MKIFKTLRLASRDYAHEWHISGCFVLALAAVLGPMLVLFGLKYGIVGGMLDQLIEDPRNREIRPASSGRFSTDWLAELAARDDVAFVVPRTRSIAASIDFKSDNAPRILPAELLSSGPGDPLLPDTVPPPEGLGRILLSRSAADKLQVGAGDTIKGSISRRYGGRKERVHLDLAVVAVAPALAFPRDGAFASVELVEALEAFRDGRAVATLGWVGDPPTTDPQYPSFRLYAKSIYDVGPLRDWLRAQHIEVHTKFGDIELVQRMDRNLTAVYWAIAVIGLVGFSLSLGASLWANVDRKRRELSVLRLVGFRTGDIVWFPMIQAFYTALLGWALAAGIYLTAAWAINDLLVTQIEPGEQVCRLLPEHFVGALVLTLACAFVAALLAGMRSARIEPSEGLRDI